MLSSKEEEKMQGAALELEKKPISLIQGRTPGLAKRAIESALTEKRREEVELAENRPEKARLKGFLSRSARLAAKRRAGAEDRRAAATPPESLSAFFARLASICEKRGAEGPSLDFSAEESGPSME